MAWLPDGCSLVDPSTWDPVIIVASPPPPPAPPPPAPPAPRPRVAPVGGVKVPINTRAVLMHTPLPTLALALVLACLAIVAIKRAKS